MKDQLIKLMRLSYFSQETYFVSEFQLLGREIPGRIENGIFGIFRQNAVKMIITTESYHFLMMIINTAQLKNHVSITIVRKTNELITTAIFKWRRARRKAVLSVDGGTHQTFGGGVPLVCKWRNTW